MLRKFIAFFALALTAVVSQALVANWDIENCSWYSDDYAFVQLVAVYTGGAEEKGDRPDALYSYYFELEDDGVHEDKSDGSWAELQLTQYMTETEDGSADLPIGYMAKYGFNGEPWEEGPQNAPAEFDFSGYSFYFQVLDAGGAPVKDGYGRTVAYTTSAWWTPTAGQSSPDSVMMSWEDVYNQYIFDAAHPHPHIWTVGVPEPCSAALMMLGVSALLLRRRVA